ncbi:putative GABA permease [Aulographum hederae CBS 113979]|uniref:Putative GABA permease n=1 Tax=Aulographum hederae CBS 113979 TaxID=1176131 RepID=A0A6G1H079_9PEZI|nr:putative GABA permease [Aulographum hederae CBS 113979]
MALGTVDAEQHGEFYTEDKNLYHDSTKEISGQDSEHRTSDDAAVRDDRDMKRMGKQQQFRRNFRRFSTLSFVCVLTATWEFLLIANYSGLANGGRPGFFWSYVWSFLGFGVIIASLAEMSSMAPTSGGQYHWVSEFAPVKYQKFMSYIAGWMSVLSWQAATASGGFLGGGIIQGLIIINHPDYEAPVWHAVIIAIVLTIGINLFNIYGSRLLAPSQNPLMVLHIFLFIAICVVLWVMAPHPSAHDVFLEFENFGGWSSMGLSLMVGQISALFGLMCNDAAAHMAEEVKDAGKTVPEAMFWSYIVNGIMGFVVVLSFVYAIPSIDDSLEDPTGFPFLYVFVQAMPNTGTNVICAFLLVLFIASSIAFNASTARQTFAFARDNGLPFSGWISKIDPKLLIPANAVWFSCILSVLLNLINLGSTAAFNAIMSLQLVALMFTYIMSISCVLYKRVTAPETLPPARWSLGRLGVPFNIASIIYSTFAFFWCFWSTETPVNLENFNWAPVIFMIVLITAIVMYFVKGRKVYHGPVVTVEGFLAERRLEGFGPTATN